VAAGVTSPTVAVTLSELTTLRLGGPADRVVTARTQAELVDAIRSADQAGEPVLLLGGGSNLVVADAGWPGVVVVVASTGVQSDGDVVTAHAGVVWDELVAQTVAEGRSGLAAMSGIPGCTGATPVQNVGAYGSEVADCISALTVLDRESGQVESWGPARCGFGFRTSAFKHTDRYVVLDVSFRLRRDELAPPVRYAELARRLGIEPGDRAPSDRLRATVLALRAEKGMLLDATDHDTWSVGSFFVNPFVEQAAAPAGCPQWVTDGVVGQVKLSAAWLIEQAGFGRGYGLDRDYGQGPNRVAVSTKHALALTNRGSATTAELLALAREIRDGVLARFAIALRPEARLVGVTL
jgi:UDP-N-acetylmuramate dehydrogenase